MRQQFETAKYIFTSYFHQDWDINGDTDADIVQYISSNETSDIVKLFKDDLMYLSQLYFDQNAELERKLSELGNEYYYEGSDLSGKQWINNLISYFS